jgi:hypothetical protein
MNIAREEWRNDSERRVAAAQVHHMWAEAAKVARGHLVAAVRAFDGIPSAGSPIRDRLPVDLRRALHGFEVDYRFVTAEPTETLIGNMAAFGVGAELLGGDPS